MAAHVHTYPHQLSGGQQQRVAIARAFRIPDHLVFMEAARIVSDTSPRDLVSADKTSRIAGFLEDVHIG
jgi:ABC-type polar amino acid transport system ATPase subunit